MHRTLIEQEMYYVETVDNRDETVFVCSVQPEDVMIEVENHAGQHHLTTEDRITREATMQEIREFNA